MPKINFGRSRHTRLHRTRGGAAVIAAMAGGLGIFLLATAAIAGITPAESPPLWIGIGVAVAVWLTGLYWRGDAPDSRREQTERERRGY